MPDKKIRVLSMILGAGSLIQGIILIGTGKFTAGKPLFDYANAALPFWAWGLGFLFSGAFILIGHVVERRWTEIVHLPSIVLYIGWGVALGFSALNPNVSTSGYPITLLLLAAGHAHCLSNWRHDDA